jgi:hypothetical protein
MNLKKLHVVIYLLFELAQIQIIKFSSWQNNQNKLNTTINNDIYNFFNYYF